MVALLGANGAGKSTTLKSISGLLAAERGEVRRAANCSFLGADIDALLPQERVKLGIAHVLEGRRVFEHLTPDENLVAASAVRSRHDMNAQQGAGLQLLSAPATNAAPARRAIYRAANNRCWRSDVP